MKRYLTFLSLLTVLLLGGIGASALESDTSSAQGNKTSASSAGNGEVRAKTGEQVFEANCARCHTPPMTLPQRVTGTIIMHMRARARLSREDEQLLLKYMAP